MKYEIIKGSEKDFEGAGEQIITVYSSPDLGRYFSNLPPGGARPSFVSVIAERRAITEPVWDGEGLPPVGSRIQYSCIKFDENRPAIESGKWYGGTVIAYHDGAVWTSDNGIRHLSNTIFRPIRSPEDVVRDEAISEMVGIYFNHGIPGKPNREDYESMGALYDAGYRKLEGK